MATGKIGGREFKKKVMELVSSNNFVGINLSIFVFRYCP